MIKSLIIAIAVGFTANLTAQSVDFLVVSKSHDYEQTDVSTTSEAAVTPYAFGSYVLGTGMTGTSPLTIASFSSPVGSLVTAGSLSYVGSSEEWEAEYAYQLPTEFHPAFNDGNYTMTLNGYTTPAVNMDSFVAPNTPQWAITSGAAMWNSGYLVVDLNETLVLTSNEFDTNFSAGSTRIGWAISGAGYDDETPGDGDFDGTSATITIPAGSLINGNTYELFLEFNRFSDTTVLSSTGVTGLDGATYVAMIGTSTTLQIYAVPEPSTYALLAGALVLMGVVWNRRRLRS